MTRTFRRFGTRFALTTRHGSPRCSNGRTPRRLPVTPSVCAVTSRTSRGSRPCRIHGRRSHTRPSRLGLSAGWKLAHITGPLVGPRFLLPADHGLGVSAQVLHDLTVQPVSDQGYKQRSTSMAWALFVCGSGSFASFRVGVYVDAFDLGGGGGMRSLCVIATRSCFISAGSDDQGLSGDGLSHRPSWSSAGMSSPQGSIPRACSSSNQRSRCESGRRRPHHGQNLIVTTDEPPS